MIKFDSPTDVKQKRFAHSKKSTLGLIFIKDTLQRFCDIVTVADREHSRRKNNEIELISKKKELYDVFQNIVKRLHLCIESNSDHFEHLL